MMQHHGSVIAAYRDLLLGVIKRHYQVNLSIIALRRAAFPSIAYWLKSEAMALIAASLISIAPENPEILGKIDSLMPQANACHVTND